MYVNFEFAALLPSPYSRVKKCAKFKTDIHLVSVDSFLYYLSSNSMLMKKLSCFLHIFFALLALIVSLVMVAFLALLVLIAL